VAVLLLGGVPEPSSPHALLQAGVPLEVLRLSDPRKPRFGVFPESPLPARGARLRVVFSLRRYVTGACSYSEGRERAGGGARRATPPRGCWREGGRPRPRALGVAPVANRFRTPTCADELLSAGWARKPGDRLSVGRSAGLTARCVTRCTVRRDACFHVRCSATSRHAYGDGASLYFTFLWPRGRHEVDQWGALKRRHRGAAGRRRHALAHQRGGHDARPYLEREIGARSWRRCARSRTGSTPGAPLNPGVLLSEER